VKSTYIKMHAATIKKFTTYFKKKTSNIKFHEYPSSASRVFPCGQTEEQA